MDNKKTNPLDKYLFNTVKAVDTDIWFIYYTQPMVDEKKKVWEGNASGIEGSGIHCMHKKSNSFLYDSMHEKGLIQFEGSLEECKELLPELVMKVKNSTYKIV